MWKEGFFFPLMLNKELQKPRKILFVEREAFFLRQTIHKNELDSVLELVTLLEGIKKP